MSDVLIKRELLEQAASMELDTTARSIRIQDELRAALTAQQPAPERVSVPRERIHIALEAVQNAMEDAYNNAYQNCCGRGNGQCCGTPEPAWSDADHAIMDALAPAQRELSALLASAPNHSEQVRVVPVEPTEAMRKAAQDKLAGEGLIVTDWLIHTAYAAMLAAAPSAGQKGGV